MKRIPFLLLCSILIIVFLITSIVLYQEYGLIEYFWYDEAGQFWITKGLNHYSYPSIVEPNILSTILKNAEFNMDPGGFSVLLHYWSRLSNEAYFLRLMPFLFLLGSGVLLALITYLWSGTLVLALFFLNMINIFDMGMLYLGFELRAYGMEIFGILLTIFVYEIYRIKKTDKYLFILGMVLSLFLTSRYPFYLFYLSVASVLLYKHKPGLLKSTYFLIPGFIISLIIYIINISGDLKKFSVAPFYTTEYLLNDKSISVFIEILLHNFTDRQVIFWNILFAIAVSSFFMTTGLKNKLKIKLLTKSRFWEFILIGTVYQFILIVLSVIGLHPWYMGRRWSASLGVINILSLAVIIILYTERVALNKGLPQVLRITYTFIFISFLSFYLQDLYTNKASITKRGGETFLFCLKNLNLDEYENIYVSKFDSGSIRYLFEYGSFKGYKGYPDDFIFENHEGDFIGLKDKKGRSVFIDSRSIKDPELRKYEIFGNKVIESAVCDPVIVYDLVEPSIADFTDVK